MGPLHSAQGSGRFENWKICVTRQQLTYPYTYPYTFFKCLLHSFAHTMPIAGSPSGLGSLNFVRTTCVPHTDSPHQPVRAVLTKVLTEFESFLPVSFFIKSTLSSQVNIQKAYWVKKNKKTIEIRSRVPLSQTCSAIEPSMMNENLPIYATKITFKDILTNLNNLLKFWANPKVTSFHQNLYLRTTDVEVFAKSVVLNFIFYELLNQMWNNIKHKFLLHQLQ